MKSLLVSMFLVGSSAFAAPVVVECTTRVTGEYGVQTSTVTNQLQEGHVIGELTMGEVAELPLKAMIYFSSPADGSQGKSFVGAVCVQHKSYSVCSEKDGLTIYDDAGSIGDNVSVKCVVK